MRHSSCDQKSAPDIGISGPTAGVAYPLRFCQISFTTPELGFALICSVMSVAVPTIS